MVWSIRWGARHGDGSFHRPAHPHHPRMDHPQFAGAHRHGADLSGAGEGRRRRRRTDLGNLSRHADRAMRAGRGLFHRACRRAAGAYSADRRPRHRHRLARRLDPRQMVPRASQGKFPLHAFRGDLRAARRNTTCRSRWATACARARRRMRTTRRNSPNWKRWASSTRIAQTPQCAGDDRRPRPCADAQDQGEHGPAARRPATRRRSTRWGR